MPIEVSWYEPNRILFHDYSGQVTTEDLRSVVQQSLTYLNNATQTVHVVVDWSKVTTMSTNGIVHLIPEARTLLSHYNMGHYAIVGLNAHLAYWLQIFNRLAGLRTSQFRTMDEAIEFVKSLV